jgi:hypothetical protein
MFVGELAVFNDEVSSDIGGFVAVAVPPEIVPHSVLIVSEVEVAASDLDRDREVGLVEGAVQV